MKIRSITKVERHKADLDTTQYRLLARDVDGINQIIMTSSNPMDGFVPEAIIKIQISQSQKSLKDFKKEE